MISRKEFVKTIQETAPKISSQGLYLASLQPENKACPLQCIYNVRQKVDKDRGSICFGWTFSYRINPQYGKYMIVTHHAIWRAPDNKLIDVTPFSDDPKNQPYSENNNVVFLVDESATPVEVGNSPAPLPLKFFAISNDEKLVDYLNELTEKEFSSCQEIYKGKFKATEISYTSQKIDKN